MSHTPGPWRLQAGRSIVTPNGTFYLSYGKDAKTGAPNFPDFCELDRNAHLIAATPDLLVAAESVDVLYAELSAALPLIANTPAFDRVQAAVKNARAAIAKAKGAQA